MLRSAFASGRIVDLILLIVAAEFLVLVGVAPRGARGARALDTAIALTPGFLLLLALRAALAGQDWLWVAAWLTLSLPAHLWDVRRRLGQRRPGPAPRRRREVEGPLSDP